MWRLKLYAEKLLRFCWSWRIEYTLLCLSAHVLPGEFNNPEKLELAQFDQLSSAWVPRGFFFFFLFIWLAGKSTSMGFYSLLKPGDLPPPHTFVLYNPDKSMKQKLMNFNKFKCFHLQQPVRRCWAHFISNDLILISIYNYSLISITHC